MALLKAMVEYENNHIEKTTLLFQKVDARSGTNFKQMIAGDAGFDLEVWNPVKGSAGYFIPSGQFRELATGLKVKVGNNSWGCIRPRSSTFRHRKLFVMEGTIDCGYTGELFIIVFNPTNDDIFINNGERLAQIIPVPMFASVNVEEVKEMPITVRGDKGFGSTGGINERNKV